MKSSSSSGLCAGLGALFVSLGGCASQPPGAEEIGSSTSPLSEGCAATHQPTASFTGSVDFTSPTTYSAPNCFKAVVLDVDDYALANTGWGTPPGRTEITWEDPQWGVCSDMMIRAQLFRKVSGVWIPDGDEKQANGTVRVGPLPVALSCTPPSVSFDKEMKPGLDYRIAATARAGNNAGPTRSLRVRSRPPVSVIFQ
jgi:hypothetical protein